MSSMTNMAAQLALNPGQGQDRVGRISSIVSSSKLSRVGVAMSTKRPVGHCHSALQLVTSSLYDQIEESKGRRAQ